MDFGLSGKRALVLASSQGLGLGIAQELAAEGVNIVMAGRSIDKLNANSDAINAKGAGKASSVQADLTDPGVVDILSNAVDQHLGGVDILINNTGGPPPGRMIDADLDEVARQMETMVLKVAAITRHFLPGMRERRWGRIITVASSGVIQPIPNLSISNMVRSALVGWSKSLSNDLAKDGITVNMLVPGRIHTERLDQIDAGTAKRMGVSLEEARTASQAAIPAGRYGTVEEFAAVAAFLASTRASYVTGGILRCDGGLIQSV